MIYDEKTATEIISRFNLNGATKKVWYHRGKIPDRYFRGDYLVEEKAAGDRDEKDMREIRRILRIGKININSLARILDFNETRLQDVLSKNILMTKREILSLKKAIVNLRNEARVISNDISLCQRNFPETTLKKIKKFLGRSEIKTFILLSDRTVAKNISNWVNGNRQLFPSEHNDYFRQVIITFVLETDML